MALGYGELVLALREMASRYSVPIEKIELYSSTQINSYLISVPGVVAAPGSGGGSLKNLFVFDHQWREWLLSPAPMGGGAVVLPSESETIERLRNAGGPQ